MTIEGITSSSDAKNFASLVMVGDELLDGSISDTNSRWIAEQLGEIGLKVKSVYVVGDDLEQIVGGLAIAARQSSVVFVSGGLGPTSDDLTRFAAAQFSGRELYQDQGAFRRLEEFLRNRGREVGDANRRQVMFPKGAEILENDLGTADAFCLKIVVHGAERTIFFLPGVPTELKHIFSRHVLESLKAALGSSCSLSRRCLRTILIPEATLGETIEQMNLPKTIQVSYRATFPGVTLTLKGGDTDELDYWIGSIKGQLSSSSVYAEQADRSLAQIVHEWFITNNKRLALAESCTGGLLADAFVSLSGSSSYLECSYVTYSNLAKQHMLGVSEELLGKYGAVSKEVVEAMAQGARQRSGADIALATSGIAGPTGGTEQKPVGTLWVGLSTSDQVHAEHFYIPRKRNDFRAYAVACAINMLRVITCSSLD